MPFQEKSAWIMSIILLICGLFYFTRIISWSDSLNDLTPPSLPIVIAYTVILAVVAALGHVVIAIFSPAEANAPSDERECKIFDRAAHRSGYVFAAGVIFSLGLYLILANGNLLFYGVFASLMIAQLAEYAIRIYYYRAGV